MYSELLTGSMQVKAMLRERVTATLLQVSAVVMCMSYPFRAAFVRRTVGAHATRRLTVCSIPLVITSSSSSSASLQDRKRMRKLFLKCDPWPPAMPPFLQSSNLHMGMLHESVQHDAVLYVCARKGVVRSRSMRVLPFARI